MCPLERPQRTHAHPLHMCVVNWKRKGRGGGAVRSLYNFENRSPRSCYRSNLARSALRRFDLFFWWHFIVVEQENRAGEHGEGLCGEAACVADKKHVKWNYLKRKFMWQALLIKNNMSKWAKRFLPLRWVDTKHVSCVCENVLDCMCERVWVRFALLNMSPHYLH